MKFTFTRHPIAALLCNLLTVYVLFTLSRLIFLILNWAMYADTLTLGHALSLFAAGLIFDTTAILYTNALVIVAMLLPLHTKEQPAYYNVVRWIYVVCNTVAIWANLADCVYFPFTGKRTTTTVFAEFSHEGVGGMTKIFMEQFLANWYLVLLGLLVPWLLWFLFRPRWARSERRTPAVASLPRYYITMTTALLLAIPLSIAAIRGGFTTAVRPITISNANQYVDRPAETGIVLNTPFAIYRTLTKKPMIVPQYMSDDEAQRLFSPIHIPADSVAFQSKNVVVFILESFGKQHFGYYNKTLRNGNFKGFTPFLDSLITHGAMTWQYSYANGRRSIEGMPSVLSSLPNYVEPLFLTPASLNKMSGLARELGEQKGYQTAFFHGAQNGSMGFMAFARATGFQRYFGRTEYNEDPRFHGDDDFDGTWAIFDEEFLQYYALQMNDMRQPFMTAVFTASSHTPFSLPERYKGKFPTGENRVMECVAYSDNAIRHFFATAKQQPWYKNTLFVFTADHTSGTVDPYYQSTLGNYCVPIILYSPADSTLHGYDRKTIVEQVDIMPTVLSYLHYDKPYLAFGKDMLSTPSDQSYALHWVPSLNGYEYVKGPYAYHFDGERVTAAYHYDTDSLQERNILRSIPADTLAQAERHMKSIIQQYMQRMTRDQLTVEK
ncbi:MAG: sulfatase-like hydrolase/transferase [Prevotella sp.]|nr:sulfatase-like hydrolase/transferase [Prevotella sp.]